jgi:hypothetical protein
MELLLRTQNRVLGPASSPSRMPLDSERPAESPPATSATSAGSTGSEALAAILINQATEDGLAVELERLPRRVGFVLRQVLETAGQGRAVCVRRTGRACSSSVRRR